MSGYSSPATAFSARAWVGRLRGRWPLFSVLGATVASALVILPLVFLVVQAQSTGLASVERLLLRHNTVLLLWNTLRLVAGCTAATAVIGVGTAWLLQRAALPMRGLWIVLLVAPLGIPDFVVSFSWVSIDHSLHGYLPTVLIMTLSLYPLVLLPTLAGFAGVDPALEEVARSLGMGPWRTFFRVTLPQILPAVLGGCLLVTLGLLAEYGAFEIMQYQTFTVAIFTQFKLGFDASSACALSLVLVALGVITLSAELGVAGSARAARIGAGAARRSSRVVLGRSRPLVLLGLSAFVAIALGLPLGALVYWTLHGGSSTLPPASILTDALNTAKYSAAAAALATVLAIPVTSLAIRHRNRVTLAIERLALLPQALPGLVIALGLVAFSVRYLFALYQSPLELVVAYAVLFLPLAVVGVRAALAYAPTNLEDVGRSLGHRPIAVWFRVTLPLIAPGVAAAFALVFISSSTELTATLLLRPTGMDTLATQFWSYTTDFAYGSAAPYALLMVAISTLPAYLLSTRIGAIARRVSR